VRANVGFKAVEIPPGRHTVILTFGHGARQVVFSLYAVTGAALCFIGLVLGLGAALRKRTS
jgi:hypothetical protein